METKRLTRAALIALGLLGCAGPARAQASDAPDESLGRPAARYEAASAQALAALLPPSCLSCRPSPSVRLTEDDARLPRGAAPVIGGVVGAVVGLIVVRVYCADRYCEMGDLFGPLVGGLLGVLVGKEIEGSFPSPEFP
jgi:hypothetical protein